ncbi:MAG: peroxiredoxin family protein [Candidatus Eisenbacteria bacterium]|uniref:Peroxiredoxin family protein n=1 Tax=Eiseniibacteriota bacterium TaxID=2212470 RepID=A0A948RUM5_UNCEI|nr:peroxiredoxin family protein [Candidatus Eisenbacteria bacterium]MBU1947461.1 peroxiredoxin family protein [Candidatus Eisenbacteria bacterium]MBU2690846.1 peroxiredoxin family protein [Candidatus Eisenbacteria bacterium]
MMKKISQKLRHPLALALLILPLLFPIQGVLGLDAGDPAPYFVVEDLDGNVYNLVQLEDTVVLLFFFDPSDPYCVTIAPQLEQAIWQTFAWHDFKVLGLNIGDPALEIVENFRDATGVTFPLIADASAIGQDYGMRSNSFVLVDGLEIVRYVASGSGAYSESELKEAVSNSLEGVAPPKEATWGRIKNLFGEKAYGALTPAQ